MKPNSGRWVVGMALLVAASVGRAESPADGGGAMPRVEPANDPVYDATGRRDPFRPPRANQTTSAGEVRSPLQRYDIGQLKLVAVIYNATEPRAVVEDDAGLGYIVKIGTPIGVNGGAVKAIERAKVRIQEESIDFYGDRQTNEVVMELASDERGKR